MTVVAANLDNQLNLDSVPTERQATATVWAAFLPTAALLLMLGEVLTPKGLDKPTTTISAASKAISVGAAHSSELYAANLLVIFGLGALGISFAAIALLLNQHNAVIGTAAALIGGFAAFCGAVANMLVGFNVAAAATAHTTPTAAAQVLVSADTSAVSSLLLVGYLGGGVVAILLMAIALWRSRTVPRWMPVLFGLGLVLAAASRPGLVALPMQLPFAVAMLFLAKQICAVGQETVTQGFRSAQ